MSIDSKHAYRFGFLKSEEWQTMRLICIAMDEGKCVLCEKYDPSNDAHHLFYRPSWKDTKPEDLLTLCRECHKHVHDLGADITAGEIWKKYKYLFTGKRGGCSICHSDNATRLFKPSEKHENNIRLCEQCFDKIRLKQIEIGTKNPWKPYKEVKSFYNALHIRRFHAKNLQKIVEVGLEKKRREDSFQFALLSAGKKIRRFLLTAS